MADETYSVAVLELEVNTIERPHHDRPVVGCKLPAERLIDTQLKRMRCGVDNRKVDDHLLKADARHQADPKSLHPEDHAAVIAANHRKGEYAATQRDGDGGNPSMLADRLSQEGIAQQLQELGQRVEIHDEVVFGREKIRLPHHRCDEEPHRQPGGDDLNNVSIAHAGHGDEISRPRHHDAGEYKGRHDLQQIPVDWHAKAKNESGDDDQAVCQDYDILVDDRIDGY